MNLPHQLILLLFLASTLFTCQESGSQSEDIELAGPAVVLQEAVAVPPSTNYFLSLSDVHLDSSSNLVFYGGDTGKNLWIEAKRKVEAVVKNKQPKFMVYLGDLPSHGGGIQERSNNVSAMLNHLRNLNVGIPILYLPGNNDSPGGDYHSFTKGTGSTKTNPFSHAASGTDPWPIINDHSGGTKVENMDYNNEFGFYATDLVIGNDTLHVIALNTVIFSNSSSYPYIGDDNITQDSATHVQFNWFRKKMDQYKKTDRVLVMMHIPPGGDGYGHSPMWNPALKVNLGSGALVSVRNGFLQEIGDHQNQIVGVLTAHTHTDGLRRLHYKDPSGNTVLSHISISTPGITVDHKNNPGFKIFEFENKTFNLIDFETYFATPDQNGTNFTFHPDSSFTFRNTYGASPSETTMFEVIKNKSHRRYIVADMKKILYLHSGHGKGFNYDRALDVWPD